MPRSKPSSSNVVAAVAAALALGALAGASLPAGTRSAKAARHPTSATVAPPASTAIGRTNRPATALADRGVVPADAEPVDGRIPLAP